MSRPWVALLTILAACGDRAMPPVPQVVPGLPVIHFIDARAPSVVDVPVTHMRAALKDLYVLKPDRRFLGAVAEVHRLLSGTPADTVRVTRGEYLWLIHYRGEFVGELPDLPGFEDASVLLRTWATRLIGRHPFGREGAPTAAESDSIRALLERLDPRSVSAALRIADDGWGRGREAGWLPLAAGGLTLLAIQLPKVDVVGDPLVARALAATALADAAGGEDSVVESRSLLAEHMGYTADAARIASRLPAGHPARLLAARERARLLSVAVNEPTELTRLLYLRTVADLGDRNGFPDAAEAVGVETLTSGILGAAVTANGFETDGMLIGAMSRTLAAEMDPIRRRAGLLERLNDALKGLFGGRASIGARTWADVLEMASGGGGALDAFERDAAALDQQVGGPFLTADLYALYFRAQLHAVFERACIHNVDGLASVPGSAQFVAAFDDVSAGFWGDAVRWCRNRAEALAGRGSVDDLLQDLSLVQGISEPALRRSLGDIVDLVRYMDAAHLTAARAVFDRLDSRPHQLRTVGQVATDRLGDVPLAERLDTRLLALASVDHPDLMVWYARYRGDARALLAYARDRTLTPKARFLALRDLLKINADSAETFAAFDRLLAEDPQNWSERDRYVDILEESRRFEEAAEVARVWLAANGPDRGFDYLFARTALARQYQYLGRLREADELLEPLQGSYQAGVLNRSASVALALGDFGRAEALAQRAVDRYPGLAFARATLAEVYWARDRNAEASAALQDAEHPLSLQDWRDEVAPAFVRAFGRRALGDGTRAFDALAAAGVAVRLLKAVPTEAADSAYPALALSLKQRVLPPPGGNEQGDDAAAVEYYRLLVAVRGEAAGLEWLGARWGPNEFRRQALSLYRHGMYDLVWDPRAPPDDGVDGSYYWLIRALAWLQAPNRDAARGAQLAAFYGRPDARYYHIAGRCVLGMEPDESLLAFATNEHRRAEVSYYLGIKALRLQRYAEASDWLRVTVETRSVRDWELLWAKDLLTRWARAGRELPIAVPQVAATPPRF